MKLILTVLITLTLAACASNPDKITGAYVSPDKYSGKTCAQLDGLYRQNQYDMQNLRDKMKSKDKKNKAGGWIGALVFWPALFFMEGKDVSADQALAMYKGNAAALTIAMQTCT